MSTRDRIIDAAATVLLERGVAGSTTKEIAKAAGCSEALLYKHFTDKQELFLAVLSQRVPDLAEESDEEPADLAGRLAHLVARMIDFFAQTFPIAVSIFGAPHLLAEHRDGMQRHGGGPEATVRFVLGRLEAERAAGHVRSGADLTTAARVLVGYAFHLAFLAVYSGQRQVADADRLAEQGVGLVLPALVQPG